MSRKKSEQVGQFDMFGGVTGIDKLVQPPNIIESEGLKVIHFAISDDDRKIPEYTEEVIKQARKLQPEVQSRGKPPWMTAEYQARKRKERAGVI